MSDNEHESPPGSRRSSFSLSGPPPSPFRRVSAKLRIPPPRPRLRKSTSKHMLPSSTQSRNQSVFSSKHRLVQRDLPFFQSNNHLQVENQHSSLRLWKLLQKDWFHVILRMNLFLSVLILLTGWTIAIVMFSGIYMAVDRGSKHGSCGLGQNYDDGSPRPIRFGPAFAFSLETCTTVGYGLPNGTNAFFEPECSGVVIAIYFQMVWSMMFNAFLFAFFFARIAKSEARGVQVIFSNRAIVSRRPESPYPCFYFRVFDIDAKHPVVEAHVRLYVVTQKSPIPMPLRVLIPNDDLGGMLYLSLPSQVAHTIDGYSPLAPKSKAKCLASATVQPEGLHLRQVDSSTNNRDDVVCPVCGESYGTVERLIKHGKYQNMIEKHDNIPYLGSHQEVDWNEWRDLLKKSTTWTVAQLESYFRSSISEILCVVEGIDPLASGTFQALHSYQLQDIHFGPAHFGDCVCLNHRGQCVVDLDFFHRINAGERTERDAKLKPNNKVVGSKTSAEVENSGLPMIPSLVPSKVNGVKPSPLKASTATFENPSNQAKPPLTSQPNDDEDTQLEPRNLVYNLKPVSQGQHTPQANANVVPGDVKSAPSRSTTAAEPQSSRVPTASAPPKPRRRFSAPTTSYKNPPPLFVVDDDLLQGENPPQQSTGRQPSRGSPKPGNTSMMNSLATGKFSCDERNN